MSESARRDLRLALNLADIGSLQVRGFDGSGRGAGQDWGDYGDLGIAR